MRSHTCVPEKTGSARARERERQGEGAESLPEMEPTFHAFYWCASEGSSPKPDPSWDPAVPGRTPFKHLLTSTGSSPTTVRHGTSFIFHSGRVGLLPFLVGLAIICIFFYKVSKNGFFRE